MPERQNAMVDQVAGNLKEFAGNVGNVIPGVDGESLIKEGQEQKTSGDAEYKAAQGQEKAESVSKGVKGTAKEAVGSVFSESLQNEGKEDQTKGDMLGEKSKH